MTAIETHRRALMHVAEETTIRLIPIEDIRVLNPRARNKQVFARLVENISALGLKRPITVAPTTGGTESYEIVCGQGRFEALQALEHPFRLWLEPGSNRCGSHEGARRGCTGLLHPAHHRH